MSNKCPKCGADCIVSEGNSPEPTCKSLLSITGAMMAQSDFCRGRADREAELDKWNTGEPPEDNDEYFQVKTDNFQPHPKIGSRVPLKFHGKIVWNIDGEKMQWQPHW